MGAVVGERFEVQELLGRGGFGNVYLVKDELRGDLAVMKELAPTGTRRGEDGTLKLETLGASTAHHLRQRFIEEGKLLAKLHLRGIPQVRATLTDLGTAFFVSDYIEGSQTVQDILDRENQLGVDQTLDIVHQVLDTLEGIHNKGFLHRDIKPSNILVSERSEAFLLDFGSAREWHADAGGRHTVLFTPGYAPLEQLSERAKRGPATDLYALCATAYHMLTGSRPPAPPDRLAGAEVTPIRMIRPEVPAEVASTIELGLALNYGERPQSVKSFRELMEAAEAEPDGLGWVEVDAKLVALESLTYERRQCPACSGVLDEPRPLRKGTCPVCREGAIRRRHIDERLCPVCRVSPLRTRANDNPLLICPLCNSGELHRRRKGLLTTASEMACGNCEGRFDLEGQKMTILDLGAAHSDVMIGAEATGEEWRNHSGRSAEVHMCDGCGAQFDTLADGRWKQVQPVAKENLSVLYPDEWARVAAGLDPGSGNAECTSCEADFFVDGESVTLLDCMADPNGFGRENLGRLLQMEELRWMGVGKDSPNPGYVCGSCGTEFDRDGDYLRLIQSPNRRLLRFVGSVHRMEDWHRMAQGLPTVADEGEFRERLDGALREAYRKGELSFDNDHRVLWSGPAERESDDLAGTLEVTVDDLSFGGRIGRWRVPFDAATVVSAAGNLLSLRVNSEPGPVVFTIEPQAIEVDLESGHCQLKLTAEDLGARLRERGRLVRP